jgi:O-antigen ligase
MKLVNNLAFITIVALPTYLLRCKTFSWCASPVPFTLLEVLILVTFSAWLVWIAYSIRKNKESLHGLFQRLRGPFILPLGLFMLSAIISLMVTSDLRGGLGIWKAYFLEGLLLYIVVVDIALKKKDFFWIVRALLLSGLLVSLYSLLRFLFFVREVGLEEAVTLRISGIYEFANAVSLYLGPIAALSTAVIFSQFKNTGRRALFYLSIFTLLSILIAVFLSQSKGGIIGIFSILVVWFGYLFYKSLTKKLREYFRYALIVLVIFYFLLNALIYLNIDNIAPEGKYKSNSLSNRYCIWQGTKNLLSDKFVTGSGLNGFHLDYNEYKTCLRSDYQYPHNILLTFWVELGLVGMLAFIWLSYKYIILNSKGKNEAVSVGLLAALIYIYIHGLVDVPFFKNDLSVQFWILLALVASNNKVKS